MNYIIKSIAIFFDTSIFKWFVKWVYPEYKRPSGYLYNFQVLKRYFFMQKIMGFNRNVRWPVDFRSKILGAEYIKKGIMCDPGDNIGVYINAYGGLKLGSNVSLGPNTIIATTNHDIYDHRKISNKRGVVIGDNVWIAGNCSILAGVNIGDNVTIGAGCTIRQDVPSNSLVIQEENNIKIADKKPYQWDWKTEELI